MVPIPEGFYLMGDLKSLSEINILDILNTDRHGLGPENPAHKVFIDAFYIDIFEVTNAKFQKYVEAEKRKRPLFSKNPDFNQPNQPVVGITWKEASAFCKWQNKRLPTEAEWEKAARGQKPINYPWGDDAPNPNKLNFDNHIKKSTTVGSYEEGKSGLGVYDLSGNVSEWVEDWHSAEYYLFSPEKNPKGPNIGQYKVIRGGSWRNNKGDVKVTFRNATVPKLKSKTVGFRCAKSSK
jgi:formylglycine-generating enzyme required for sulfatase activity